MGHGLFSHGGFYALGVNSVVMGLPALLAGLDDTILIAVTGIGVIDESADLDALLRPVFSDAVRTKIRSRVVEEVRVNSVCRIYRLTPAR